MARVRRELLTEGTKQSATVSGAREPVPQLGRDPARPGLIGGNGASQGVHAVSRVCRTGHTNRAAPSRRTIQHPHGSTTQASRGLFAGRPSSAAARATVSSGLAVLIIMAMALLTFITSVLPCARVPAGVASVQTRVAVTTVPADVVTVRTRAAVTTVRTAVAVHLPQGNGTE